MSDFYNCSRCRAFPCQCSVGDNRATFFSTVPPAPPDFSAIEKQRARASEAEAIISELAKLPVSNGMRPKTVQLNALIERAREFVKPSRGERG